MTYSSPLTISILSACCYGGWVFLQKLGSQKLTGLEVQLLVSMTSFSFSVLNFTKSKGVAFPGVGDSMGAAMSIAAGISSFLGTRLFTRALEAGGSVGMVSAVTGSYPAVAFVLSVAMLGENIQTNKVAGLFLALASAVAFSMEPEAPTEEEKIKAG